MSYRVEVKQSAEKELAALPVDVRARVGEKITALGAEPRPHGVQKLAGFERTYRVRVGDYRIVYEVIDAEQFVSVTAIGHRREVYR